MTARKTDTWIFPDREPNGMASTGALPHIPVVPPVCADDVALATRCVNRHATDARDADRLKRALGLVGAR